MIEGKEKCSIIEELHTEMVSAFQNTQTCAREREKLPCKLGDNVFICMYWDDRLMKIM